MRYDPDVAVIGAGPAGALCAAVLADHGLKVMIVEAATFPRFSIGESLLPQVLECLEIAGMRDAVERAGFQYKDGAYFACGERRESFVFADKTAPGPAHAYEVKRADFDLLLAEQAAQRGVRIDYGTKVSGWSREADRVVLECLGESGEFSVACRFLVDASGFGRVLARLADLEYPSTLPPRGAIFHHLKHRHLNGEFDRNKITIAQADLDRPYWFWFIPFSDASASFGLVGDADLCRGGNLDHTLAAHAQTVPLLQEWLCDAIPLTETRAIVGYSCNVKQLFGERFVLLGNAGEFVDPIFSSGVSIACRSAILAAPLVVRQLRGESVDWRGEYELPLRRGVNVFHVFVQAWYEGTFPRLIYTTNKHELYRRHISSILAGYVWDRDNPFTKVTVERLRTLVKVAQG